MQPAIAVYSSDELDLEDGGEAENNVQLKNWLVEGREKLDAAREALKYLCEPVSPPREMEQYLHTFCGAADDPEALHDTEPLRIAFYKQVAIYLRAFAAIAQHFDEAGYTAGEIVALNDEVAFFAEVRAAIKRHSNEELDIKPFEPTHSERFVAILDEHYPTWREARAELNELPLAAESFQPT